MIHGSIKNYILLLIVQIEMLGGIFNGTFLSLVSLQNINLHQYYDWHNDPWDKPYDRKDKNAPDNGKVRKLSMTCQLTDGSEYTGGELEFDFRNYDPHMRDESKHVRQVPEILPKGSIVVFPSHLWHRVKPVTRGTRYSLVVWHLGNPFK